MPTDDSMRREPVAILCYPTIGGSGRIACQLAKGLAARGHDVRVVSYEEPVFLDPAIRFEREFKARTQANILAADGAFTAWRAASAAATSSEEAVSKMRRGFSLGAKSLAELMLAEQRHLDIKRTEAESRFAAHLAHLQVLIDAHEIWIVHHHEDEDEEDTSG